MIDDPRLRTRVIHITRIIERAEVYNSPLQSHESVGSRSKPGSRPPGHQQCPHFIEGLIRYLDSVIANASGMVDNAPVYDAHARLAKAVEEER